MWGTYRTPHPIHKESRIQQWHESFRTTWISTQSDASHASTPDIACTTPTLTKHLRRTYNQRFRTIKKRENQAWSSTNTRTMELSTAVDVCRWKANWPMHAPTDLGYLMYNVDGSIYYVSQYERDMHRVPLLLLYQRSLSTTAETSPLASRERTSCPDRGSQDRVSSTKGCCSCRPSSSYSQFCGILALGATYWKDLEGTAQTLTRRGSSSQKPPDRADSDRTIEAPPFGNWQPRQNRSWKDDDENGPFFPHETTFESSGIKWDAGCHGFMHSANSHLARALWSHQAVSRFHPKCTKNLYMLPTQTYP